MPASIAEMMMVLARKIALLAALLLGCNPLMVHAQAAPDEPEALWPEQDEDQGRRFFEAEDPYTIVNSARGLSAHRPSYVHPLSWSPDLAGGNYELLFQLSAKQRLFNSQFYFAYTQRSFWQLYNKAESSPFRETNYNPEVFYRFPPRRVNFGGWGVDVGFDHESNGRSQPDSRSWNRVFAAAYRPVGKELFYVKGWWRVPERAKRSPEDPRGDDNPDISDFYGYTELHYQRQLDAGKQLLSVMLRGNPATGRGAVELSWSLPAAGRYAFLGVQLWHGYGESLIDYNQETTRLGIGIWLTR